jgi:exodeoxyribonuclease VII large subunit
MEKNKISLKDLQELISSAISTELGGYFWVSAEISELKINYSGHCYLELVEKEKKESLISARARAVIWSRKARFLLPYFKTTAGIPLGEGMAVLLKVKIEYHTVYGISLLVEDIDPAYTMGDLAIKRNEIISRLRSEGVIDMNKDIPLPYHPEKIAVISSGEAAGFEDFKNQLINNSYGYKYRISLFKAVMQGTETEKSVINALSDISESISEFDIVTIVRGGGSQYDLSWFDNYDIAYFITQFPIPVISGIGHEKDISVTDMVAHTSCKTPTAVADLIIEQTAETDRYIESLGRNIIRSSKQELDKSKRYINSIGTKLISSSRLSLTATRIRLINRKEQIRSGTKLFLRDKYSEIERLRSDLKSEPVKLLSKLDSDLKNISKTVEHLSPEKVLERGYSITLRNGKPLLKTGGINRGDRITTILHDGKIDSEIFDIKE